MGENMESEDVTLGSEKICWAFFPFKLINNQQNDLQVYHHH